MNTATKRLRRELIEARKSGEVDIALACDEDDIRKWTATLQGPPDTPFEGGVFEVRISCKSSYPLEPPVMHFVTKIFHPNVHWERGDICLDILKDKWSPAWGIASALRAVLAMLAEPNAESPYNCDAGNLIRAGNVAGYEAAVAQTPNQVIAIKMIHDQSPRGPRQYEGWRATVRRARFPAKF